MKGDINMLDKIRAMKETADKMEQMQNDVLTEIKKDRKQLRMEALQKIFAYLDEVAEALGDDKVSIHLERGNVFWNDDWTYVSFNSKCYLSSHHTSQSEMVFKWSIRGDNGYYDIGNTNYRRKFIDGSCSEKEMLSDNGDNSSSWEDGYINLIENWDLIKAQIESGITSYYQTKMENIRKNTQDKLTSYEKAANFTV